jgi:3D-(3,5/4)-trihydroxycyclohexane-1,2-dione acylhydrolase (decyclizing)
VLTSPAETGAVTLALPQDVQTDAYDFPAALFRKRIWTVRRQPADEVSLHRAVEAVRASRKPLIVAGGGVLYSEASRALADFAAQTGIPVAETQAGKGSLAYDHAQSVGAIGATGVSAANRLASDVDLVIGIGTRYSDFTTASMTAFQNPDVRFVNINVAEFDAYKVSAIPLVADARAALEEMAVSLRGYRVAAEYEENIKSLRETWTKEMQRLLQFKNHPLMAQSAVIGAMFEASGPRDVLVSAAGSHPGDLHKLWPTRTPNGYHMEYGYSCMGYEIPGAMGAKMADPSREVFVFLGDGTYQMMPTEIVTAVQEGVKLIILLVDNHGFASIGGLSESIGSAGFGTRYQERSKATGQLDGKNLLVDYVANARSLGARATKANNLAELKKALAEAKASVVTTVIVVETDREVRVPGYDSWWEVAVAEVSESESVRAARSKYEEARRKERYFL